MKYTLPILISDLSKNRDYSRKASWKIMGWYAERKYQAARERPAIFRPQNLLSM